MRYPSPVRLAPPVTDAPPLRWVPLAALPAPLRATVTARAALEPLRGPLGAWWHPTFTWGRTLPLQMLGFGAGASAIATSDAAALGVASLLLACVAGWAAWWLDRPCAGLAREPALGALTTSTSLVLVDRDAVAVAGAEHLERRDDRWWYGDTLLDDAPHPAAWNDTLADVARRARADLHAREEDAWRPFATHWGGGSLRAARGRHAARVATAALVAFAATWVVARRATAPASESVAQRPLALSPGGGDDAAPEATSGELDRAAREAVARAEAELQRVRGAAAAGDEQALRAMLAAPDAYGLSDEDAMALRARLGAWCAERFGLLPEDVGLRAIVRVALELRCVDPSEAIPLVTIATRCQSGTSRCRALPAEARRDRRELAGFLERQLAALGAPGAVSFRAPSIDEPLYVRVERRESVNVTPVRGDSGPARAGTIFRRADLVNAAGRGVGRLVEPSTTVALFPTDTRDGGAEPWW